MSGKFLLGIFIIGLFLAGTFAYTWRLLKYLNQADRKRIDPQRSQSWDDEEPWP